MAKNICIFCGAANAVTEDYKSMAFNLGQRIAQLKWGVVYGGGHVGLMGQAADGCLSSQGPVVGVIPQSLVDRELAHDRVTELHVVKTMHERKALMADLSHAFLALPGGFGTFDELCEIITWRQLGIHNKPIAILNYRGFFNTFIEQIHHAAQEGFISKSHFEMLIIEDTADKILERIGREL